MLMPSVASSAAYWRVSAFLGSVRMRTNSSAASGVSSTRIGNRPCISGMREAHRGAGAFAGGGGGPVWSHAAPHQQSGAREDRPLQRGYPRGHAVSRGSPGRDRLLLGTPARDCRRPAAGQRVVGMVRRCRPSGPQPLLSTSRSRLTAGQGGVILPVLAVGVPWGSLRFGDPMTADTVRGVAQLGRAHGSGP